MVLEKLESYVQNNKMECFLTVYAKINSEWIEDLNVRPKTVKFLEDNIGSNFFDIGHRNIFLDGSSHTRETIAKLNY